MLRRVLDLLAERAVLASYRDDSTLVSEVQLAV